MQAKYPAAQMSSPVLREVRSGIEPELRPYHGRVLLEHLQTNSSSDPGWNRTITFLDVGQASSPLDHGISIDSDRGGRRTHNHEAPLPSGSRLAALPVCVPGQIQIADPGIEPGIQPYESRLSASSSASVTHAGIEPAPRD